MEKVLRSLIQENIDHELRVELDLLSRRRDIVNEEKQEEVIKLLRKYEINDIVNLAPGTNRYGFKLNGFVIKVATDNDGKIDNLKEFKMSKRLYPDMSKTHEVSQNGTLLVAEYIPPFQSYSEMLRYADKIRKILTKISSAGYLIGDVGISAKNYANWGVRIGTDDPVCFDYAYIYDVTSDLFICRECGSMLVPDSDFVELYCSNKACGKKVLFETLRGRIGNDIHRHEIGDLTEEGYLMRSSNVLTELTPNRSNYLLQKKSIKKKKREIEKKNEINEVEDVSFVMERPVVYQKGENIMNDVIRGIARTAVKDAVSKNKLVFKGSTSTVVPHKTTNSTTNKTAVMTTKKQDKPASKESTSSRVVFSGKVVSNTNEENTKDESKDVEIVENTVDVIDPVKLLDDKFKNEFQRAISKLSNRIGTFMESKGLFDYVQDHLSDKKMTPATFYKNIQNAVFRSLVIFCNFTEEEVPNNNGNGTHKKFLPPSEIIGTCFEPSAIFIERMWNTKELISIENPIDCLSKYREIYDGRYDIIGIQSSWLTEFAERISTKMAISDEGIRIIVNLTGNYWCYGFEEMEVKEPIKEEPKTDLDKVKDKINDLRDMEYGPEYHADFSKLHHVEILNFNSVINNQLCLIEADLINPCIRYFVDGVIKHVDTYSTLPSLLEALNDMDNISIISYCESFIDDVEVDDPESSDESEGNIFTSYKIDKSIGDEDNEEFLDGDESSDEDQIINYLSVDIYPEDEFDIIRIQTSDAFGEISIPLYTRSIDEVNPDPNDRLTPVAIKNGVWHWLSIMVPDLMFNTEDPDYYLRVNSMIDPDEEQSHIIILKEDKGIYTMGVFFVNGIYIVGEEEQYTPVFDNELLAKLNKVIIDNLWYGDVSHLTRSLSMTNLIYPEETIKNMISSSVVSEKEEETEAEQAAVAAMMEEDYPQNTELIESESPDDEAGEDKEGEEVVMDKGTTKPIDERGPVKKGYLRPIV